MRHTERIERINANLNKHFKSNKDGWWVNNEGCTGPQMVCLHHGIGGERLTAPQIAAYILKTEPSVHIVHFAMGCSAYTRTTLGWAGYKF